MYELKLKSRLSTDRLMHTYIHIVISQDQDQMNKSRKGDIYNIFCFINVHSDYSEATQGGAVKSVKGPEGNTHTFSPTTPSYIHTHTTAQAPNTHTQSSG